MAKHIIGLILFSLIVGVSVFVAGVTNSSSSVDVAKSYRLIAKKKKKRKKKRRCRHRQSEKVTLNQISFSRNSELLSASFDETGRAFGYKDAQVVQIHFFAKDQHGSRFLKTEYLSYEGDGIESSKETPWLTRIDRGQNIYVMAEAAQNSRFTTQPDFDSSVAVPLLISD